MVSLVGGPEGWVRTSGSKRGEDDVKNGMFRISHSHSDKPVVSFHVNLLIAFFLFKLLHLWINLFPADQNTDQHSTLLPAK